MSKRKGLSLADKRAKLLEFFHESKDVFQLKDIERLAPKAKAIPAQNVKSLLQELVDEGLIESAKFGAVVCFWSFPNKSRKDLSQRLKDLEDKNAFSDEKLKILKDCVESLRGGDQDSEACANLAKNIEQLKERQNRLEEALKGLNENDPEIVKQKMKESKEIFEAANRWTDNIFSVKSWCKRKFAVEEKDLNKNFEIPEDLDYLPES